MHSLGKTLLGSGLLHFVFKAKHDCSSRYLLTSYFCIPFPYDGKKNFFGVNSRRSNIRKQFNTEYNISYILCENNFLVKPLWAKHRRTRKLKSWGLQQELFYCKDEERNVSTSCSNWNSITSSSFVHSDTS